MIAVLALFIEPTIDELHGIASEEGVAECTVSVEEIVNNLVTAGKVKTIADSKRYQLTS